MIARRQCRMVYVDDRRRYDLVTELVLARFFVCACVGSLLLYGDFPITDPAYCTPQTIISLLAVYGAAFALPSAAAKSGARTFPAVWLASVVAMIGPVWGAIAAGAEPRMCAIFGSVGAAVGLVEGLLERSIATTYAGALGGMAVGFAGGLLADWLNYPETLRNDLFFALPVLLAVHVGVALSLALGRRVRDLPKRDGLQPRPEPSDESDGAAGPNGEAQDEKAEEEG